MTKGIIVMDVPEKASDCIRCPLLNDNDECILQSDDQNEKSGNMGRFAKCMSNKTSFKRNRNAII